MVIITIFQLAFFRYCNVMSRVRWEEGWRGSPVEIMDLGVLHSVHFTVCHDCGGFWKRREKGLRVVVVRNMRREVWCEDVNNGEALLTFPEK